MQEIRRLGEGDCLISFNYDALAERLLRARGKNLRMGNMSNHTNVHESILLCKPHGSLSWKVLVPSTVPPVVEPWDRAITSGEVDYVPQSGTEVQPGIIAPVPFKEQIAVPELQASVSDFYQLIVAQWKGLLASVSNADEMVVMGYGFPKEDFHAMHVFGEAAARRTERLSVTVYSKSNFHKIKGLIEGLFQNVILTDAGPVIP